MGWWRRVSIRSASSGRRRLFPKSRSAYVSGNFFRALGVEPALGRGFLDSEDQSVGRDRVVLLGYDYWLSQFNANPAAVGSTVWLNNMPFTIVGVAPHGFTGVDQFINPSVFVPLAMSPTLNGESNLERREVRWLAVKGRLKPGVSIGQASAELAAIAARLEQMYPQTNRAQRVGVGVGVGVGAESEFEMRVRQSPPNAALVAMLMLLALCVLVVACANVTGLLLAVAGGAAAIAVAYAGTSFA